MPRTATPIFTEDQLNIVKSCVHATWNYIACDVEDECSNKEAIELTIDASRLRSFGGEKGAEAEKIVTDALDSHKYNKVLTFLSKHIKLIS